MATAKRTMTKEHKEALAVGRTENTAVKHYLNALSESAPKKGKPGPYRDASDLPLEVS
jgi:hypothetical protein